MKTIQLFIATLLCLFTIQFAQAGTSPIAYSGEPTCHCCTSCKDEACQEMCAKLDELNKDDSKKEEATALAAKCQSHCATSKACSKKMKKKSKSCCATH